MRISKQQLIREIHEETGYTVYDLREVFRVMQQLVYDHMKNMDEVHIFEGLTLSGTKRAAHKHHSEFGGDFEMPEYVGPKATFTDGIKYYLRGFKEIKNDN